MIVEVSIPFDPAISKNATHRVGKHGGIYLQKPGKTIRNDLIRAIKAQGGEWYEGRVWLDVIVQKPNHRTDALNVLDAVADAVKEGIGVDDRWYSATLRWEMEKDSPMLTVRILQVTREHRRICSTCGVEQGLDAFTRNKSDRLGHGRVCRECSRVSRLKKTAGASPAGGSGH
jgi:hypothetical protein